MVIVDATAAVDLLVDEVVTVLVDAVLEVVGADTSEPSRVKVLKRSIIVNSS